MWSTSDAPIIRSAIGIGPIMRFLGSIGIGKFYRLRGPINDACALQNHMLAILFLERCMRARDGATCLATREEGLRFESNSQRERYSR